MSTNEASPVEEADHALMNLGQQLSDPSLKSSTRMLILISLALNKRLGFTELLTLTGTALLNNYI
jgi:hypothetical protein